MLDAAGYRDALIRPGPSHGALLITGPFERGPGLARLNRALARIAGLRVWVLARQASDGGLASRTVAKHLLAAVYGGGPAHAPVAAQDATGGRSARPACAALVAAVASVESGGRQFAADGGVLRSSRGALGIMQLMPKTAMAFGVDARDASANLLGGRAYLAWLSNHYGGAWDKAVVAYNWGPGHLDRALKVYGVDWWAHVPLETRTYLNLVTEKLEFLDKNR